MNNKETSKSEEKKPQGPPKSVFREYFESLVTTLIMAIFGMTFVIQAVTVPTGSMQNTILIGDYLLVNKFIFAPGSTPLPFLPQREIKRGDIIVFKYPGYPETRLTPKAMEDQGGIPYQTNFVKRVIGLPGETIEFRNNKVFINGELLPENYVVADTPKEKNGRKNQNAALDVVREEAKQEGAGYSVYYSSETTEAAKNGSSLTEPYFYGVSGKPMKIPDDSYFVIGDSRDNSLDSRFWGFVSRDLVIGRAMFVYWSCDRANDQSGFGCITHPRLDRIGRLIQ